eukprot:6022530-Amphidinium_carterae.1
MGVEKHPVQRGIFPPSDDAEPHAELSDLHFTEDIRSAERNIDVAVRELDSYCECGYVRKFATRADLVKFLGSEP